MGSTNVHNSVLPALPTVPSVSACYLYTILTHCMQQAVSHQQRAGLTGDFIVHQQRQPPSRLSAHSETCAPPEANQDRPPALFSKLAGRLSSASQVVFQVGMPGCIPGCIPGPPPWHPGPAPLTFSYHQADNQMGTCTVRLDSAMSCFVVTVSLHLSTIPTQLAVRRFRVV